MTDLVSTTNVKKPTHVHESNTSDGRKEKMNRTRPQFTLILSLEKTWWKSIGQTHWFVASQCLVPTLLRYFQLSSSSLSHSRAYTFSCRWQDFPRPPLLPPSSLSIPSSRRSPASPMPTQGLERLWASPPLLNKSGSQTARGGIRAQQCSRATRIRGRPAFVGTDGCSQHLLRLHPPQPSPPTPSLVHRPRPTTSTLCASSSCL